MIPSEMALGSNQPPTERVANALSFQKAAFKVALTNHLRLLKNVK
jgi:hypothetical protein